MILNALTATGITSLMGPNVWGLSGHRDEENSSSPTKDHYRRTGKPGIPNTAHWEAMIPGVVEGTIIASNLDSLICSLGTWFDPLMSIEGDVILALEDWNIAKKPLTAADRLYTEPQAGKRLRDL